ncbi:hypothetical protein BDV93DRAFT_553435 [Ceratobasidium sp. AG-I]|nr:hypothetical protein BDV93DRAFT_553435 [Ceratobasidium sp. AG-I]
MPDTYTLRIKDGKTYLQLLVEWEQKVGTIVNWDQEQRADDGHRFYLTPIINGQAMKDCTGVASKVQLAKNNAAKLLSDNKRLYHR